jgi:hypothetical protein
MEKPLTITYIYISIECDILSRCRRQKERYIESDGLMSISDAGKALLYSCQTPLTVVHYLDDSVI